MIEVKSMSKPLYNELEEMNADEIIERLEQEYKDDEDALEDIDRAKKNIAYIRKQKGYAEQTPKQHALELANTLIYWN